MSFGVDAAAALATPVAVQEVQTIVQSWSGSAPLYGSFHLYFPDSTGALSAAVTLNWNEDPAAMKAAIEGMPDVGTVDVTRSESNAGGAEVWYSWAVTFISRTGNVPSIVVDGSTLRACTERERESDAPFF